MRVRWPLALAALLLTACPGRLRDVNLFELDASVPCPAGIDVPSDIFVPTCGQAGCHEASNPQGSLDLVSPNVELRLIGKPSSTCPGYILVEDPATGFLQQKLLPHPPCGEQMPLGLPPLSRGELTCVEDWIASVLDGGSP